jgi:dihydrofolate synthase/folylpolyglutamate synthase
MSTEASALLDRDQALAWLQSIPKFGEGIGLHRILHLTREVAASPWWQGLDTLRITGSKGKGSVSVVAGAILHQLGVKVGLFTSPHLLRFEERIQIDGQPMEPDALVAGVRWLMDERAAYARQFPEDRLGAFEAFTAMALRYFWQHQTEAVVAEVGIGGRYDPTRAQPGQLVALTSVELEHTELLGATTELIAYDKADLCPSGGTLLVGRLDPELLRRLRAYCQLRNVTVVDVTAEVALTQPVYRAGTMQFGMSFAGLDFGPVTSSLVGEHQAHNIGLASLLVWRWVLRNRPAVSAERFRAAVHQALRTISWPGRMEVVSTEPTIVVDVGHTRDSARTAARTIEAMFPGRPILLVTGVSANKDVRGVLEELVPVADAIVCTRAHHKGSPAATIAGLCQALRPGLVVHTDDDLGRAVDFARALAARQDAVMFVAGGLFLAIEAGVHLRGGDPRALRFF